MILLQIHDGYWKLYGKWTREELPFALKKFFDEEFSRIKGEHHGREEKRGNPSLLSPLKKTMNRSRLEMLLALLKNIIS